MTKLLYFTALSLMLLSLTGCYKNDFQSCSEYWTKAAKKDHPDEWETQAEFYVALRCSLSK